MGVFTETVTHAVSETEYTRVTYNNAEISERDTEFLECWENPAHAQTVCTRPSLPLRKEASVHIEHSVLHRGSLTVSDVGKLGKYKVLSLMH